MGRLEGKIALITGGTSGIGRAAAERFRHEGAVVIVSGANPDNVAAAQSRGFEAIRCDQGSLTDLDNLMASIRGRHGRLDVLFVNAGISGGRHRLDTVDAATFDTIIGVNLRGVLFTVQKALPLMPDGGSIVLTASVGAHLGMAGASIYAASKAGVRSFARSFAAELMSRRIRVNTLTPGLIDTPLFDHLEVPREEILGRLGAMVPMSRPGRPEEAADAALFLASDESSFMTGAEIRVSGGQTDL